MENDEDAQVVECALHGPQQATFVCRHVVQSLRDDQPRGFWTSEVSLDNPRPDAWCTECEELVNRVGEWNDATEAFAGVTLLCGACYDRAREMDQATKPWARKLTGKCSGPWARSATCKGR